MSVISNQCLHEALYTHAPPPRDGYRRVWIHEPSRIPYWHYEKQPTQDEVNRGNNALQRWYDRLLGERIHRGDDRVIWPITPFNEMYWSEYHETLLPVEEDIEHANEEVFRDSIHRENNGTSSLQYQQQRQQQSRNNFIYSNLTRSPGNLNRVVGSMLNSNESNERF